MKKRTVIAVILILSCILIYAKPLQVHVNENRFLVNGTKTNLEVNYAVPYSAMDFIKFNLGYQAELFVDINIKYNGELIQNQSLTNGIIVKQLEKVYSDEVYMDKISITLAAYELDIEITFTDVHTERSYTWAYKLDPLMQDAIASDMELSSQISADTTAYLERFHRDGKLYNVKPDHSFAIENSTISFYQELYNLFEDENGNYQAEVEMVISKNDEPFNTLNFSFSDKWQDINSVSDNIRIDDLEEGYYEINETVTDLVTGFQETRNDHFFLKSERIVLPRFFPDIEDDFTLGTYFFNANQKGVWKTLSEDGKKNFLAKFWQANDPNPATTENEFTEELHKRIDYADKFFSHFRPGWTSDMGRIYIKYGQPYEITKHQTNSNENQFTDDSSDDSSSDGFSTYSGSTYAIKDYQIWKYRLKKNANYVFLDSMTNGNYKLIYSSDDEDGETSLENWRDYLGDDFEDGLLN